MPTGQGKAFRVVHDHAIGNLLSAFCVGTLYISADGVNYQAERASEFVLSKYDRSRRRLPCALLDVERPDVEEDAQLVIRAGEVNSAVSDPQKPSRGSQRVDHVARVGRE